MRIQDANAMQDILRQVTQNISGDPRTTTVWETLVAPTVHAQSSKPEDETGSGSDTVPDDSVELSEEAAKLRDEMKKALDDAKAQTAEMNKKLSYMEIARRMSMGDKVATSDQIELQNSSLPQRCCPPWSRIPTPKHMSPFSKTK